MKLEQKLTAFLLQSKVFSEHDELLTAFTLENGRVRLLAKGVRKPVSRLRSGLVVPSLAELRVLDTSIERVIGARTLESLNTAELSGFTRALWYWLVELVTKGTPEHQPLPELFRVINQIWGILKQSANLSRQAALVVAIWSCIMWLQLSGFKLVLPVDNADAVLDTEAGGFVASSGARELDISAEVCGFLKMLEASKDVEDIFKSRIPDEKSLETAFFKLTLLVGEILQYKWKSLSVWHEGI